MGRIWKTPSAQYASRVEDFIQSLCSFLISLVVTCTLMLDYRAHLDLPSYGWDSQRRYTVKDVCWCVKEEVGSWFGMGAGE